MIRPIVFPDGATASALGQGTWHMGENPGRRSREVRAIRLGIDLGMTLIDTAEMYGDGGAEEMLGEALDGVRDQVFLVSKVYPQNAGRGRIERACESSLKRLKTDRLDLYLLHWRGAVPLAETVEGMEALVVAGKIRRWGVSNLDLDDMHELFEAGGEACAANQVLYNITERGPEFDLIPELAAGGIPTMAYSPVGQGRLPSSAGLASAARRHDATPFQIALAWTMRNPAVMSIPKATNLDHLSDNRRAAEIVFSDQDLREIDADFPPPGRKTRLAML